MPVTNYIWDVVSDNVLIEKDNAGNAIACYVQEPTLYGEVNSQDRNGETRYYNYDGLGNTAELTDENENVTDTNEYSAFGEEVARTGTTENPFGYKGALGYYTDSETRTIDFRSRPYDPIIGRWLATAPHGVVAGANAYAWGSDQAETVQEKSGTIAITIAQPQREKCGTVVSERTYSINKAPCTGYFAQLILYACFQEPCCCNLPPWKVKQVASGEPGQFDVAGAESHVILEFFTESRVQKGTAGKLKSPDRFAMGDIDETCGLHFGAATVMFICETHLLDVLEFSNRLQFPSSFHVRTRCDNRHVTNPLSFDYDEEPNKVDALKRLNSATNSPMHWQMRRWRCCDQDNNKNTDIYRDFPAPNGS